MDFTEIEINRVALKLHGRIYQWSASQFDPGWVMDVGSELGVGINLMQAENADLTMIGCDVNISTLRISRSITGSQGQEMIQAEGVKLPISSECLSGICMINILHLVEEPQALIAEAYRTLKYAGKVVVYIDLTKLPLRWEAKQLATHVDELLGSQFHLTGQEGTLTIEIEGFSLKNISRKKIYLRLGEKRRFVDP